MAWLVGTVHCWHRLMAWQIKIDNLVAERHCTGSIFPVKILCGKTLVAALLATTKTGFAWYQGLSQVALADIRK